jgi:hypothetical protein
MNLRVLNASKPATCTNSDHWATGYLDSDPRIVPVFLVPFGSFDANGGITVPVIDFGYFYVRGWNGQGQGFDNPCPDQTPAKGYLLGNFMRGFEPNDGNTDTDGTACNLDPSSLAPCVGVLTR